MSQEDFPIEFVLESIEAVMMAKQPKVLLFDIGGVCVISPFQAILNYELANSIPPGWINFSISRTAPTGTWHQLERGEILLDTTYFYNFTKDLHNPTLWSAFYTTKARVANPSLPPEVPPMPKVNAEFVFWKMMSESRTFDPWMYPALLALKKSGRYIIAALSNTVIFPPSHPYSNPKPEEDIKAIFDLFISSAHVGLRKPSPEIYALALKEIDDFSRENASGRGGKELGWKDGVKADEILFLDDIGENLKAGKKAGFRTLKVNLGRAFEAVDELEKVTGLKIAGTHPKIPVEPKYPKKAKL
ncbi:epoxide hydrolase [Amylocarpus encephaloides]|uniref:Epoxide hydrolase n=1 Tax=Amylocarpus encephaloides TaxID=45428 RepID=A0A9P8C457_9HELO|nr:epoxide hydrolase [Amylocarpus encephaloides]